MNTVIVETKPSIIQKITGRVWRYFYAKRMNKTRNTRLECYREMMAERDSRPLIATNR